MLAGMSEYCSARLLGRFSKVAVYALTWGRKSNRSDNRESCVSQLFRESPMQPSISVLIEQLD